MCVFCFALSLACKCKKDAKICSQPGGKCRCIWLADAKAMVGELPPSARRMAELSWYSPGALIGSFMGFPGFGLPYCGWMKSISHHLGNPSMI